MVELKAMLNIGWFRRIEPEHSTFKFVSNLAQVAAVQAVRQLNLPLHRCRFLL
jgi:hypothetical protein